MRYLPLHFDLQGRNVLVVGGGAQAERKIDLLLAAGAKITCLAPQLSPAIQEKLAAPPHTLVSATWGTPHCQWLRHCRTPPQGGSDKNAASAAVSSAALQREDAMALRRRAIIKEAATAAASTTPPSARGLSESRECANAAGVGGWGGNAVALVIAATNNPETNRAVSEEAQRANIPVNVVDAPELCTVTFPAIIDRSPLVVSVGTAGASPTLARQLRERLEALVPEGYGRLADYLASRRAQLKARFKNLAKRRRATEAFLEGPGASLAMQGKPDQADPYLFNPAEQGKAKPHLSEPAEQGKAKPHLSEPAEQGKAKPHLSEPAEQGGAAPHVSEPPEQDKTDQAPHLSKPAEQVQGEVYLVGAGPGDPDLLTLKALQLMQRADIILYDNLVSPQVLARARRDAHREFVGKRSGYKSTTQEDINALLVRLAREGKRTLRLKGGDPFIFGRGGEEIITLIEQGIPFQVVPGITAATGCAAYAGIPLTHRDLAQSVRLLTGHPKDGEVRLPWQECASEDETLVFYMGLGGLASICSQLMQHGRPPSTPIAIVSKGTTPEQRVLKGTLETMPGLAARTQIQSPTLIIVGQVVAFASAPSAVPQRD